MKLSAKKVAEIFEFMDDIRDSGIINVYGAAPSLLKSFPELGDKYGARLVLTAWMKTFMDGSTKERAALAIERGLI